MRQKYTQAKKARRGSSFWGKIQHAPQSEDRRKKRLALQSVRIFRKTYGEHVIRVQRIRKKETDQFGNPRYKFVLHSANV